jgi:hypothetical protein
VAQKRKRKRKSSELAQSYHNQPKKLGASRQQVVVMRIISQYTALFFQGSSVALLIFLPINLANAGAMQESSKYEYNPANKQSPVTIYP